MPSNHGFPNTLELCSSYNWGLAWLVIFSHIPSCISSSICVMLHSLLPCSYRLRRSVRCVYVPCCRRVTPLVWRLQHRAESCLANHCPGQRLVWPSLTPGRQAQSQQSPEGGSWQTGLAAPPAPRRSAHLSNQSINQLHFLSLGLIRGVNRQ